MNKHISDYLQELKGKSEKVVLKSLISTITDLTSIALKEADFHEVYLITGDIREKVINRKLAIKQGDEIAESMGLKKESIYKIIGSCHTEIKKGLKESQEISIKMNLIDINEETVEVSTSLFYENDGWQAIIYLNGDDCRNGTHLELEYFIN